MIRDTRITGKKESLKSTAEGMCPKFPYNSIKHSPMGSMLMYFVPKWCHEAPELIEMMKTRTSRTE